jgi:hypothetical protein
MNYVLVNLHVFLCDAYSTAFDKVLLFFIYTSYYISIRYVRAVKVLTSTLQILCINIKYRYILFVSIITLSVSRL